MAKRKNGVVETPVVSETTEQQHDLFTAAKRGGEKYEMVEVSWADIAGCSSLNFGRGDWATKAQRTGQIASLSTGYDRTQPIKIVPIDDLSDSDKMALFAFREQMITGLIESTEKGTPALRTLIAAREKTPQFLIVDGNMRWLSLGDIIADGGTVPDTIPAMLFRGLSETDRATVATVANNPQEGVVRQSSRSYYAVILRLMSRGIRPLTTDSGRINSARYKAVLAARITESDPLVYADLRQKLLKDDEPWKKLSLSELPRLAAKSSPIEAALWNKGKAKDPSKQVTAVAPAALSSELTSLIDGQVEDTLNLSKLSAIGLNLPANCPPPLVGLFTLLATGPSPADVMDYVNGNNSVVWERAKIAPELRKIYMPSVKDGAGDG